MTSDVRDKVVAAVERTFIILVAILVAGCASVSSYGPRVPSHALTDPAGTSLGRALANDIAERPGQSGFLVYDRGRESLLSRLALAASAERTLDLQYYIVDSGLTTDVLLRSLIGAAARGVRVRILLDDIHGPNRTFAFEATAAHTGIEVRLFNPFLIGGAQGIGRLMEFVGDGERLNRRMHNKLWIADNTAGLIGGRNLADEYFDAKPSANFADLDLLAVGPVVKQLSQGFDEYWNSASAVPFKALLGTAPGPEDSARVLADLRARLLAANNTEDGKEFAADELVHPPIDLDLPFIWGTAYAAHDDPDKPETAITSGMQHVLPQIRTIPAATTSELLVMSPYFIPSAEGRRHLNEMTRRGVRVAVVTNSLASTDALAAHAGYARHRTDLLRAGVELFELRPEPGVQHPAMHRWRGAWSATLHAKLIIVDRARVLLGSMNLDPRSRLHNTEAWVGIESQELALRLTELFDESTRADHSFQLLLEHPWEEGESMVWITEEQGGEVRHSTEPLAGLWVRFWRDVLSVVVPEHML